jgi:glutamate-ammonia-ligase adenylyltransferase
LIKARPVAGDLVLGDRFLKEVEPFIYRRYLDFSTIGELREMKSRIEKELLAPGIRDRNVKLGYGGIREVEFFVQALQLLNGGRQPAQNPDCSGSTGPFDPEEARGRALFGPAVGIQKKPGRR